MLVHAEAAAAAAACCCFTWWVGGGAGVGDLSLTWCWAGGHRDGRGGVAVAVLAEEGRRGTSSSGGA